MEARVEAVVGRWDDGEPTDRWTEPHLHWTTSNMAEAMPGIQTPLSWTLHSRVADRSGREGFFSIGAFTRSERVPPLRERDRNVRAFRGRAAVKLEFVTTIGDRMPGTTGEQVAENVFGQVPADVVFEPTKRRYPVVAWRLPTAFATYPRRIRAMTGDYERWYSETVPRVGGLEGDELIAVFCDATERFSAGMVLQTIGIFSNMQPVYEALRQTVEAAGAGDVSLLSGFSGGAEMAVINDIWAASRGQLEVEAVAARHGFHGPNEGELESRVWREDHEPLRRMIDQYAQLSDADDPARRDAEREKLRVASERELLAAVPRAQRAPTRLILKYARERLPLRGVAKRSFLQGFDVARAAARRAGELMAADGLLDGPDDVFYLTATELAGGPPDDVRDLVAHRRELRTSYSELELPTGWGGMPEVREKGDPEKAGDGDHDEPISGMPVSGGVTEGVARVVTNPDFAEVEPDEILVAHATDPSWSSIMFISSALVMDVGGTLSHAAVVARELGIPCVVNTRVGSRRIRTGDRVRVDGNTGAVEILSDPG